MPASARGLGPTNEVLITQRVFTKFNHIFKNGFREIVEKDKIEEKLKRFAEPHKIV